MPWSNHLYGSPFELNCARFPKRSLSLSHTHTHAHTHAHVHASMRMRTCSLLSLVNPHSCCLLPIWACAGGGSRTCPLSTPIHAACSLFGHAQVVVVAARVRAGAAAGCWVGSTPRSSRLCTLEWLSAPQSGWAAPLWRYELRAKR